MSPVAPVDSVHAHPILLHPSSCFCRYASPSGPLLGALVCQRGRWQQGEKSRRLGKKRYAGGFLLMSLAIYTYLCACLPRWLVSCMHCGPGLMSCCAFACSLETRRVKRGFRFVCASVCECVGCALFVCVSYLLCHVQVLPSGTRRPVVVGRQGRFGNETKRLRESQRAMIRHD